VKEKERRVLPDSLMKERGKEKEEEKEVEEEEEKEMEIEAGQPILVPHPLHLRKARDERPIPSTNC
jgi:hypothetical protein